MRGGFALPGLLLLAACATDSVVLLPNEDGAETGAVAVIDEKRGNEVVVDQPLTLARLTPGSAPRPVKKLNKSQGELLSSLPPKAVSFQLNFPQGSTTLMADSRPIIDAIRAEIARRPGAEVQVTGHTDTVDSEEVNDRLSLRRAEAVAAQLVTEGFPSDIVSAVGRGERELLVPTPDNTPNDLNRRVEVIVR